MEGNNSKRENSSFCLADPFFHKAHEQFTINLITVIFNTATGSVGVITNLILIEHVPN